MENEEKLMTQKDISETKQLDLLPEKKNNTIDIDELPYTEAQMKLRVEEKKAIAKYVLDQLIPARKAVFLDAGTTVRFIAREIFKREREGKKLNLTLMTNNMGVFNDFNTVPEEGGPPPEHTLSLLLTGGNFNKQHDALFGAQAARALEEFYPHVVVIGTSGFCFKSGLYYHGHTEEKIIKEAIFRKTTTHRIIACDYTKIGERNSYMCGRNVELLDGTDLCTIVTSCVPESESREMRELYEKRFNLEVEEFNNLIKTLQDRYSNKWEKHISPIRLIRVRKDGQVETRLPG